MMTWQSVQARQHDDQGLLAALADTTATVAQCGPLAGGQAAEAAMTNGRLEWQRKHCTFAGNEPDDSFMQTNSLDRTLQARSRVATARLRAVLGAASRGLQASS